MNRSLYLLSFAAVFCLSTAVSYAQTPPAQGGQGRRFGAGGPGGGGGQGAAPRPYSEVVTKDAVIQEGLFKVIQVDERVMFEIPAAAMGKELLWKATTSGGTSDGTFAGQLSGEAVVRFSRRGNKVFMKEVDYSLRNAANKDEGYKKNVSINSTETIVGQFPVATEAPNGSPVIDVTALFLGSPSEIGSRRAGGGPGVDAARSYIEKVKAFPINVEVTSTETLMGGVGGQFVQAVAGATTQQVHYSMVELPPTPRQGRLWDSRIGFFNTGFTTIGSDLNRVEDKSYITRFPLDKKDPKAAISEPVQPITWYLGPEIPARWKPYVRQGLLSWNAAFEGAGFKNAIVVKDAPNDPDWSPEDARFSVVRWSPRAVENAYSGPIVDPRSGQTISAQMVVFQDVLKLATDWYHVQCGAIDPRATKIPPDDALLGDLLRYVVSHEEGHALGLRHNWKASSWYTVKQLRDPKFTSENGVSASIMDYSRFNYVAQPGDGVTRTIGFVGPYDKFAIEWGYTPIAAGNPEDEVPILDVWLGKQVTDPRLRYWPEGDPIDPAAQNEDISDDAVAAGKLGFRNIDRIAKNTLLASTSKFGKDYSSLAEIQGMLQTQRMEETIHVLKNVGGVVGTDYHAGRGGDVYEPVSKAKQAECVSFLMNDALVPSADLFAPAILNKIEPSGITSQVAGLQMQILSSLFGDARLIRLTDNENLNGAKAYTVKQLLRDVTADAWAELDSSKLSIGFVRRSLQRSYLRVMDQKINTPSPSITDIKALTIDTLKQLALKIDKAIPRSADYDTRISLIAARSDIEKILENKFAVPAPAGSPAPAPFAGRRAQALMGCSSDLFVPLNFDDK